MTIINESKLELNNRMRAVAGAFGLVRGAWSTAALIRILGSCICDRKIEYLFKNPNALKRERKFDSYYREKSSFATMTVLDRIKSALLVNDLNAQIQTEKRSEVGRYDVVLALDSPCKVYAGGEEALRIEVKASLGINLEQIARYLWDPSPLILVRIMTRHVTKIEPVALQPYVLFMLRELIKKVDRVLLNKSYTISGTDCYSCPDSDCPHNRHRPKFESLIRMRNDDFGEDLTSFLCNLSYVSDATATIVVEELRKFQTKRGVSKDFSKINH